MMTDKCTLCPRKCGLDRSAGRGFCGAPENIKLALVKKHFGEEPVISGTKGSGTIFFSHCNLQCVFCQNCEISSGGKGKEITVQRLVEIFKELEASSVHNINLVSPTHYARQILQALQLYKPAIPVVYNTNSYDDPDMLKKLAPYIDIYLADLKFCDSALSTKYAKCPDYFQVATRAIKQMRANAPEDQFSNGVMTKGLIVRHMVMPSATNDSIRIIDWLADNLPDTMISVMCQYVPYHNADKYPEINRKVSVLEYKRVCTHMLSRGLDNGYFQQFSSATTDEIPVWDYSGV